MVALIYEAGGLKVIAFCDGPDAHGRCPHIQPGEVVSCAGMDLALSKDEWVPPLAGMDRHHFQVPAQFRVCPLTAHGAFGAVYGGADGYFSPFAPDGL